jgi:ribonuclease J
VLYDLMHANEGRRIITACFASHIHRVQQIADAAIASRSQVVATARALDEARNVRAGARDGPAHIPDSALIDIEDVDRYQPGRGVRASPRARRASRCRRWR